MRESGMIIGIENSEFRLYDARVEAVARFGGGSGNALGCPFLPPYVYTASKGGLSTKVVATTKFQDPARLRRPRCLLALEVNNTPIERVRYGRESSFKNIRPAHSAVRGAGNFRVDLKYLPKVVAVKAGLSEVFGGISGKYTSLKFKNIIIAYTDAGICARVYSFFDIVTGAVVNVNINFASTLPAIKIASYRDVKL